MTEVNFSAEEIFEQIGRLYMTNLKLTAALKEARTKEEDEPDGG